MNIKDLYLQSYIGGGTGLAKKEALQIPKGFNAKNRARIRKLLRLESNPDYKKLQDLVRTTNSFLIPLTPLEGKAVRAYGLDPNLRWFTRNGRPISELDLARNPNLAKQVVDEIKFNLKAHQDANLPPFPPDMGITLGGVLRNFAMRLAKKRSIQKGGIQHLPETSPEGFTELYKGYDFVPFNTLSPAHQAPTTGGYAENGAIWFSPQRSVAKNYGGSLAIFKTTPEIKEFAERTSTPHLGSRPAWDDRMSGKARIDAQTIYKGKGGAHYQDDPNDVNYETVLPYQYWRYYLQHPELVTLYDKRTKMGYTPLYRKLLI